MKRFRLLLRLLACYLVVNTIVYWLSDGVVGAVRDVSLRQIVEADIYASDANGGVFQAGSPAAAISQIVTYLKSRRYNIDASYVSLLGSNKVNIKNIEVQSSRASPNLKCRLEDRTRQYFVRLTFVDTNKDGPVKVDYLFGVQPKTFFSPLSAKVACLLAEYVTRIDGNAQPQSNPVLVDRTRLSPYQNYGSMGITVNPH